MSKKGKILAGAAGAILLLAIARGAVWWVKIQPVIKPDFSVKTVETRFYTAKYPAHWPDVVTEGPGLSDEFIFFRNHSPAELGLTVWDERPQTLTLDNTTATQGDRSINETIARIADPDGFPETATLKLNNGIEAKTWTQETGYFEITATNRWYVFQAQNGDIYVSMTGLPPEWAVRRRYDHIFRNILGSLEFKTLPADRKKP